MSGGGFAGAYVVSLGLGYFWLGCSVVWHVVVGFLQLVLFCFISGFVWCCLQVCFARFVCLFLNVVGVGFNSVG